MKFLNNIDGADKLVTDSSRRFVSDVEKTSWNNKVDKVTSKGLSTEDYTTAEKTKLAGVATGANNYVHPTTAGNKHIPTGGASGQILRYSASGTAVWGEDSDTITTINGKTGAISKADIVALGIPAQDTVVDISGKVDKVAGKGLSTEDYTTTEKTKLAGIATGANNYTHPASHPASMITDLPTGKKVARFVVGTSTAGWTAADCDYLCDGTADQTEINAAITALPATGGEVVILDGTYNITAKINVTKDNVSIRGNGNATILKRMFNSFVKEGVITLTSRSGCKIANLQIEGNKTSYTNNYNYGICLNSSSDNTVTGNTCYNNNSYGICLDTSSDNTVTGNTCNNNNCGIRLNSSSNNTVTGNTCNNNNYGIYLASSSNNVTVICNTCNNNNYGICLASSSNNVTGNTCYNNNSYGIYLHYSSNNTITGNTFIRGTGLAADYTESQHTIQLNGTGNNYNLISNNNCMGKAVTTEGGTGNTIIDNKWSNSSGRILESYSEKLVTLSGTATTIDLSLGNVFTHTLSGNTTYSITNAVNGQAHSFTLIITQTATVRTITFPASVKWQGGEIPDLTTASKTYVLTFMTVNGGTTWLGMFGGEF